MIDFMLEKGFHHNQQILDIINDSFERGQGQSDIQSFHTPKIVDLRI